MSWHSSLFCLLEKFLDGSAPPQIDENLEKFVSYFKKQENEEINSGLITHPIFLKWIKQSVAAWTSAQITPSTNVATFTLNLASFLSKNEEYFCCLNTVNNFYIKLVNILEVRQPPTAPSVILAYINLLSSFLEHKSGIEWMTASNFWEDIYDLAVREDDEKIVEESTKFMSKILEKTIEHDEKFCNNVVRRIMAPLSENIYRALKGANNSEFCNEIAARHLKPTLRLIGKILCHFLERVYAKKDNYGVPFMFLRHFHLEQRISDFMIISYSQHLVLDLAKIMFIVQFLELYVKSLTKTITTNETKIIVDQIRKNYISSLAKKKFEDIIDMSFFGILYWNLVNLELPSANVGNSFSVHLVLVLMVPCYVILFWSKCYLKPSHLEELISEDAIRDLFHEKMMKSACSDLVRVAYHVGQGLGRNPNVVKICYHCFTSLKNIRNYFTDDQAVSIFQIFIYFALDIVRAIKEFPKVLDFFLEKPQYVGHIFEILRVFVEKSNVKWKDSCETIEIIPLCLDFLAFPQLPSGVVVEILKLVHVAIRNYLPPNLALLVDDTTGSSITLLGPILYMKLHDDELKLAVLDVILTMSAFSSCKFPSLQKVLMDSELPTLVVKMSTCDGESFVRATAIKCLQEMIQVEEIWNNALKTEDLPQKMRDILLNEAEGIVRVEAATFMCVAYEYQQFAKENLDRIYETMIYSSTTDLHWEVKVRALNFWDKVIKNHLQNQGMIDDSFPNVTFSKEHRKIVTLTDSEIRKRLLKVLGQLSSIGCLGVLMSAIKDDCDMEVSKTAVKITQRLIDLFKKYNVRSDSSTPNSPALTENGMSAAVSLSSGISVDESMDSPASSSNHPEVNEEIIDQIVNSKDVSLLKSVYTPSDYGSVSNYDIQVRKVVTPNEFLQFCQQDLNSLIAEKKNWLNGIEDLGSLLDDMLKSYEDDVNNMDCY